MDIINYFKSFFKLPKPKYKFKKSSEGQNIIVKIPSLFPGNILVRIEHIEEGQLENVYIITIFRPNRSKLYRIPESKIHHADVSNEREWLLDKLITENEYDS